MPVKKLLAIFLFVLPFFGSAQDRCSTVEYETIRKQKNPRLENTKDFEKWVTDQLQQRKLESNSTQQTCDVTYTIPVVFHIIHKGEAVGTGVNLSNAQILSQIDVLNKDYQRLNSDASSTPTEFQSLAGSFSIQFVLAKQDPNGEPTNGIVRIKGSQNTWALSDDALLKSQSYWPAEQYLNIWICDMGSGLIGYAQFPQSTQLPGLEDAPSNRLTDGVIIDYVAVGSVEDGNFSLDSRYNRGRTATHEIGHFLGLRHIWGDDSGACTGTDYVNDTPNQANSNTGCPSHPKVTCNETNMFQNFLDYTNDACMNLFTKGQVDRMTIILNNSPRRASLLTSPGAKLPTGGTNIVDIGISSYNNPMPVSCVTNPSPSITVINKGTITIYDFKVLTTVNNGAVQSQTITTIGISPGAEVTYNLNSVALAAGLNSISIELADPNSSIDNDVQDNFLNIRTVVNATKDIIPLRQNFESSFEQAWSVVSQNQTAWLASATNKGQSLMYAAFNNCCLTAESWIASPILDLSRLEKASVFFDVSYGQKGTSQDGLKILVSKDCGATYDLTPAYEKSGSLLATASSSTSWLPTTSSDWRREYVDLSDYTGNKYVRIAFVSKNANGNNIFIDNVEFFADNNSNPVQVAQGYSIYQGSTDFNLTFNLDTRQDVRMQIYNVTGQLVIDNLMYDVLNQTYNVDFNPTAAGIYLVRLQIGQQLTTTKVFVSR